jgi:hypothetical protein
MERLQKTERRSDNIRLNVTTLLVSDIAEFGPERELSESSPQPVLGSFLLVVLARKLAHWTVLLETLKT